MNGINDRVGPLLQEKESPKVQKERDRQNAARVVSQSMQTILAPVLAEYNASPRLRERQLSLKFNQFSTNDNGESSGRLTITKADYIYKTENPLIRLSAKSRENGLDLCWEFRAESDGYEVGSAYWHEPVRFHDVGQPENLEKFKQVMDRKIASYISNPSGNECEYNWC